MSQSSKLFSAARVRVLEKKLVGREELMRLIDAQTAEAASKMLSERSYGAMSADENESHDPLQSMLDNEIRAAREQLKELTTDERVSDVFLLRPDIGNLKLLIKNKLRAIELDTVEINENATIPPALLKSMVKVWEFVGFPQIISDALYKLGNDLGITRDLTDAEDTSAGETPVIDPAAISTALDRAYYEYARSTDNAFLNEYFAAECDFVNLSALYRIKLRSGSASDFLNALMPEGNISHEALTASFYADDESQRIKFLTKGVSGEFLNALRRALTPVDTIDQPYMIERERDNYLIGLAKRGKYDMETVLPVISLYLARLREAECIRMIITLKRNGVEGSVIKERLRETYV